MAEAAWIGKVRNGGATPHRAVQGCAHGWATPPGHMFQVRGPNYLETRAKIAGGEPLLQALGFDWVRSSVKIFNIMKNPNSRVRHALEEALREGRRRMKGGGGGAKIGGEPFVWAINLQVPSKENHSLVFYYVMWEAAEKGSLMQRFLDGDSMFRNARLKLLANVAAGPWIVKKAVGERGGGACLLGKAVSCVYNREANFMEVDVDIGASLVANAVVHLAFASVSSLTVDLAFVLEGRAEAELPEQILATVRFANLDPKEAPWLEAAAPPPPMASSSSSAAAAAATPSFWRSVSSLLHASHHEPVANVEEEEESYEDCQQYYSSGIKCPRKN